MSSTHLYIFCIVIVLSFSILILSEASLISSAYRYQNGIKKEAEIKKSINELITEILIDCQLLKDDEVDFDNAKNLNALVDKYKHLSFSIEDVSTGINTDLLDTAITENEKLQFLMSKKGKSIIVDYGWMSYQYHSNTKLEEIKKEFGVTNSDSLFPLINNLPLNNINYMDEELLEVYLEIFNYENADELVYIFNQMKSNGIGVNDILNVLKIKDTNLLMSILGTKTSFWKIDFIYLNYNVELIIAAIPEKDFRKVSEYVLIEKSVVRSDS